MLCSKLHCQKSFELKHISYKIRTQPLERYNHIRNDHIRKMTLSSMLDYSGNGFPALRRRLGHERLPPTPYSLNINFSTLNPQPWTP